MSERAFWWFRIHLHLRFWLIKLLFQPSSPLVGRMNRQGGPMCRSVAKNEGRKGHEGSTAGPIIPSEDPLGRKRAHVSSVCEEQLAQFGVGSGRAAILPLWALDWFSYMIRGL